MKLTFIKVPIKTVLTGVQYGTSSIKHFPQNIKIVGMKDLSDGKVLTNNLFLGDIPKNTIKQFKLKKGDILLNRTNSYELVGKVGIYDSDETAVFASYLVRLNVIKEKIDSYFLNYFLNLSSTQKEIRKIVTRAIGQANINPSQFIRHCMIPDIPLPEQKKIAKILGTWDLAIEKLTALIEQKKLLKKGLMQRLLTGKQRLPGFSTTWNKVKLGDFLTFQTGFPFDSQFFNQKGIGIRLVKNRDLKSDDQIYFYSGIHTADDIVRNGDILVGMDGDFLPCLWKKGIALLNQRVGRVLCKKNLDHTFAYYALSSPLERLQNETVSTTVKHLSHSGVLKIKTSIPLALSEQKAIANILFKADEEIDLLTRKLSALKEQKTGLMQKLLTGQIRVKVA